MSQEKQFHFESNNEDEHLIHLKHQVNISFDENYDYYLKNKFKVFLSKIVVSFGVSLFKIINFFHHGLKVKNKKILKEFRKQKKSYISIANHCLILDSTMAVCTNYPRKTYITTVEPTMKIPFVRHILRAVNVMPIPFNMKGLVKFKNDSLEILKNGQTIHYFPEAALWPYYGKLRQFKPGAFRFAIDANVPIIPFCIYFRERKGLWKLLGKKLLVTMQILEPIYPNTELSKKLAINDLMERCHSAMKEVIDRHPYDNPQYAEFEAKMEQANENLADNNLTPNAEETAVQMSISDTQNANSNTNSTDNK